MNVTLRMDDDADFFEGDGKENVGFDDFEGFVEEQGGFNGDFFAHLVARVCQGLGEDGLFDLFTGPAEERAAGARNDEFADFGGGASFEDFVYSVVFGVDGDDFCGVDFRASDEGFFVGEKDFFAEFLGF